MSFFGLSKGISSFLLPVSLKTGTFSAILSAHKVLDCLFLCLILV
jgi:hypothetical protein